jgi:hypothetical protein
MPVERRLAGMERFIVAGRDLDDSIHFEHIAPFRELRSGSHVCFDRRNILHAATCSVSQRQEFEPTTLPDC